MHVLRKTYCDLLLGRMLPPENWYSLYYSRPDKWLAELAPRHWLAVDEPELELTPTVGRLLHWLETGAPELVPVPKLPLAERRQLLADFVATQPPALCQILAPCLTPARVESALASWRPHALESLFWEVDQDLFDAVQAAWNQAQAAYCRPWLNWFCRTHGIRFEEAGWFRLRRRRSKPRARR